MAPAAGQDAADRPRRGPHRRRRRDQGASVLGAALSGMARPHPDRAGGFAGDEHPGAPAQPAHAARPPAGLRLHPGRPEIPDVADGHHRAGSGRFDGHRHPAVGAVDAAQAALFLFQAGLRPGHQPADRPDPRGAGDVAARADRPAPQLARHRRHHAAKAPRSPPAHPDQPGSGKDPLDRRDRRQRVQDRDPRPDLPRRGGRRRHGPGAGGGLRPGRAGVPGRLQHPGAERPRDRRRPHRHPGAARHLRGAPSSGADRAQELPRAGGRDRRGARGPSFLHPRRLRRRGDQPLSRLRDACRRCRTTCRRS